MTQGRSIGDDEDAVAHLRVAFIMCTEVGLRTQYLNWRAGLTRDHDIDPVWIEVDWWRPEGLLERIPVVPRAVKARLRAQLEIRDGMTAGPFDAVFVAGHTLYGLSSILARQPYFVTADVTAKQLYAFGDLYGKQPSSFGFVEARKHGERTRLYRRAAALFPWSHWAAASMVEDYGADPAHVHVIPPGVDVERWRCPARADRESVRILFVGGDFERKGGDLLLAWAARTAARGWELDLVTRAPVGSPDPRIRVHNGIAPNSPELMELYRRADVFALPTRGDCYSLAGMEAMAAGLPVVLSRTGGTGDIIRDGETGFLIGPGDGAALGERLEYLAARPAERRQMGACARADAEERYDSRRNIARTVKTMRAALGA
ncbi:MAG: glycosyltransferase family 4 protein [Chthonomonadales bacterium]|nr:glycosyltransferase family 4 protein [Chthonomonadales bacterium]